MGAALAEQAAGRGPVYSFNSFTVLLFTEAYPLLFNF
jgi:hypothetical protein